jgi:CheY-like chemotaxis protein
MHMQPSATPAVLVVDDNCLNRTLVVKALGSLGFKVDEAKDGLAAVKSCSITNYRLILMDIMMPGMDGLEATRIIRKMAGQAEEPIVVAYSATRAEDPDYRKQCFSAGMNDFLPKPARVADLQDLAMRWLREYRG